MPEEFLEVVKDLADQFSRIASALEDSNELERKRILLEHGKDEPDPTTL